MGSHGGSVPSSDRARGPSGRSSGSLRVVDICSDRCKIAAWRWSLEPRTTVVPERSAAARRPADRAAHRQRACRCPSCGPSCARSTTCATSAACCSCWAQAAAHRRPGRVDRQPARLRVAPSCSWARSFARFAILGHEAAHRLLFTNKDWNDSDRPLGAGLPVVRAARRLPAWPLRAPQGRVRPQRARPQPLQRLPDHPGAASAASCGATPAASSGWKSLKGLLARVQEPGRPTAGAAHRADAAAAAASSPSRSAAGGSTRCCGWRRG